MKTTIPKKTTIPTSSPLVLSVVGILFAAGPLRADLLRFADNFNRPNSSTTNGSGLNQSANGKSGSLGTLTWTGKTVLPNTGNIVDINDNSLRMDAVSSSGGNGGLAYINDHNFIDASIKAAGSFEVSIDITTVSSGGEGRVIGFGIGQSLADLNAMTSASPAASPNGSDVHIGYDDIGSVRGITVHHNGTNVTLTPLPFPVGTPSLPDTLTAVFTFADMNAGTTLNYAIFLDGISVGSGSTTWGATDQNYILLSSTYTNPSTMDNFSVSVPGPPVIVATVPADNATGTVPAADLVATFDEPIALGASGSVTIRNLTNPGDIVISLPGPDPDGSLLVSGLDLIIDPAVNLVPGNEYVIEISSGTVQDLSANGFAGLLASDVPNWSFTPDGTPPASVAMGPMTGAIGVQRSADLTLSFDESVLAVAGKFITVRKQDGTLVESIDASAAIIAGGQVTIPVATDLGLGNSYYVTIEAGAFTDLSGNPFAGIAGSTVWTFTTVLADITYLDASVVTGGNTFLTSDPDNTTWLNTTQDSATQNNTEWVVRNGPDLGNNNNLLQSRPTAGNFPQISTRISGLADGTYTIWAFFWDQVTSVNENWGLSAGLAGGALTTYSAPGEPAVSGATTANVTNAAGLGFISPIKVQQGETSPGSGVFNLELFGVNLGQFVVSGGSVVDVSIDNNLVGTSNWRVFYDGIGHQLISSAEQAEPRITSFSSVGGGVWELTLEGAANTNYEFRSSTTLDFTPGTLVENLTKGDPGDPGTIGGTNNRVVTTNASGLATVRLVLTGSPADFVRAQATP